MKGGVSNSSRCADRLLWLKVSPSLRFQSLCYLEQTMSMWRDLSLQGTVFTTSNSTLQPPIKPRRHSGQRWLIWNMSSQIVVWVGCFAWALWQQLPSHRFSEQCIMKLRSASAVSLNRNHILLKGTFWTHRVPLRWEHVWMHTVQPGFSLVTKEAVCPTKFYSQHAAGQMQSLPQSSGWQLWLGKKLCEASLEWWILSPDQPLCCGWL